jgi:Mg-chelatase subunit ChlD
MEWLTPLTALYAAAVTVPLLLLLYFLKLKRRQQPVSSTLLWKRAIQDLQVNAPFQRLRRNILLLLQLLMLAAILLALAGPILSLSSGPARRYVLLIDRSASMTATDVSPSRLDEARKLAHTFVSSVRDRSFFSVGDNADQVMVIAFDKSARVMCNFTSDKKQLHMALDAITPSNGLSSLAQALTVARAFAQSPGRDANNRSSVDLASLILFSDGKISDLSELAVAKDELRFTSIGSSDENLGIIAMQSRRTYENPDKVEVFATLANFGPKAATTDVRMSIDDTVRSVKRVTVPAMAKDPATAKAVPGKLAVEFSLMHPGAGLIEVRQMTRDAMACDDAAWSVLLPPKRLSVLLVSSGNVALEAALKACHLAKLDKASPAQFDAMDHAAMSIEQPYDLIVLDGHSPAQGKYPRARYVVFGTPPQGLDVTVSEVLKNQMIADWRPRHPVLQYVDLTNLYAAKALSLTLPRDAEVLAEFNDTPAIALLRRGGSQFLLVGFDPMQTNWPFEPGFVLFCYNAAAFLGSQDGQQQSSTVHIGDPIIVEGLPADTLVTVSGPGMPKRELKASSAGVVRFPEVELAGPYMMSIAGRPPRLFAANLLDDRESDIAPAATLSLSGTEVVSSDKPAQRANLPLWPFLVAAALCICCLEWYVYNSKLRL